MHQGLVKLAHSTRAILFRQAQPGRRTHQPWKEGFQHIVLALNTQCLHTIKVPKNSAVVKRQSFQRIHRFHRIIQLFFRNNLKPEKASFQANAFGKKVTIISIRKVSNPMRQRKSNAS